MTIEEFLTEPGSWEMYPGAERAAKPRLRWRHYSSIDVWTVTRAMGDHMPAISPSFHMPESYLLDYATGLLFP